MAATRRGRPRRPDWTGVKFEKSVSETRKEELWSEEWRNFVTIMGDLGFNMYASIVAQTPKIVVMQGRTVIDEHHLGNGTILPLAQEIVNEKMQLML